jgi:hypothetical protein
MLIWGRGVKNVLFSEKNIFSKDILGNKFIISPEIWKGDYF